MSTKSPIDIICTGGLWCRILGDAFTEIVKQEPTRDLDRRFRLWAWDTDSRGISSLLPDPLNRSPVAEEALNAARPKPDKLRSYEEFCNAFTQQIQSDNDSQVLIVFASIGSGKTFPSTCDLLYRLLESGRRVLLVVLANHHRGISEAEANKNGIDAGRKKVITGRKKVIKLLNLFPDQLRVLHLSRAMFLKDAEIPLDDDRRNHCMDVLRHFVWLWFTLRDTSVQSPEPIDFAERLYDTLDITGEWSLGHVQFDTTNPNLEISENTLIPFTDEKERKARADEEPKARAVEISGASNAYNLLHWNHLGSITSRNTAQAMAGFLFHGDKRNVDLRYDGIEWHQYASHRIDQLDVLLAIRSSQD